MLREKTLYIADQFRGLEIVDVADPARPRRISSFSPGGTLSGLTVEGKILYLVDFRLGMFVIGA
jgi:hypothetical protein